MDKFWAYERMMRYLEGHMGEQREQKWLLISVWDQSVAAPPKNEDTPLDGRKSICGKTISSPGDLWPGHYFTLRVTLYARTDTVARWAQFLRRQNKRKECLIDAWNLSDEPAKMNRATYFCKRRSLYIYWKTHTRSRRLLWGEDERGERK